LALNFNASYVVWGEAYFDDLKVYTIYICTA